MDQGPPPGLDLKESRVPLILGLNISTWLLALSAIILRIVTRKLTKQRIWWDDVLVIVSFLSASVFIFTFIGWTIPKGLGRHIWVAAPDIALALNKTLFVSEITYTVAIVAVKFSILAFFWRIFQVGKIRIPIYVLTAIVACWGLAVFLVTLLQCLPLSAFWDRIIDPSLASKCGIDVNKFYAANAIPNIVTDVALICLPLPFIWNLQLRQAQKIALTNIFLLGFFVVGVSITRLILLLELDVNSPDLTWDLGPGEIMSTVEMNIAVVVACLPSLRPLLLFMMTGTWNRDAGTTPSPPKDIPSRSWIQRMRQRARPTETEDLFSHPFSRMNGTDTNSVPPGSALDTTREVPLEDMGKDRQASAATAVASDITEHHEK